MSNLVILQAGPRESVGAGSTPGVVPESRREGGERDGIGRAANMVGDVYEQELWGLWTETWISVCHHMLFIIVPPEPHACMGLALGMCLHLFYFILFIQNIFIYFLLLLMSKSVVLSELECKLSSFKFIFCFPSLTPSSHCQFSGQLRQS